jgi:hypothetical protein
MGGAVVPVIIGPDWISLWIAVRHRVPLPDFRPRPERRLLGKAADNERHYEPEEVSGGAYGLRTRRTVHASLALALIRLVGIGAFSLRIESSCRLETKPRQFHTCN